MHAPRVLTLVAVSAALAAAGDRTAPRWLGVPLPSVCFAPGTSTKVVERVYRDLEQRRAVSRQSVSSSSQSLELFQYFPGDRWSSTATNLGPLQEGDPTTLLWSIVPDGTFIPGSAGEPGGASNLKARLNQIYPGGEAVWKPLFVQIFNRWGQLTGNTYLEAGDDGAPFPGSPGAVGTRGDLRVGGHFIDGNSDILAYNFFPDTGDMVIDTADNFFSNTGSNSLALRNVLTHEHGHGLGIEHVCPVNQSKLMEPFVSFAFDGVQHDDQLAGQRGYGDDREPNDSTAQGTPLGALGNGTVQLADVSLDHLNDADFFTFSLPVRKRVTVTVTPVGFTYVQGPQNANGSCTPGTSFNSAIENNPAFDVIADGVGTLATFNTAPAGSVETASNLTLGPGTFHVRVFPGHIDGSSPPTNNTQLYSLRLDLVDAPVTADVGVTKTDGVTTAVPGQALTYTITVTNAGPDSAGGTTVVDTFPAAFLGATWTCAASFGSGCTATSGAGNINTTVGLLAGGSAVFTVTGTVSPSALGTIVNTATVAAAAGVTDGNGANNSSTDTDTLTPQADLSVTKANGVATVVPGQSTTYTITVTNAGPSDAGGTVVTDVFPAALSGVTWTCAASFGSGCTAVSGTGAIATTVGLVAGGTATFTATGMVDPAATGTLANTATVAPRVDVTDPSGANNSATDSDPLTPQVNLAITKTDGRTTLAPGESTTYTITVTNAGPSQATGAVVADTFPAAVTAVSWTCSTVGAASCGAPSGSGNINETVTVGPGAIIVFAAQATISAAATGTLSNTASVSAPAGTTETDGSDNAATDVDTLTPRADLQMTKTDGQLRTQPGQALAYTITARNVGPSDVPSAQVADVVLSSLTGASWTCAAAGGAACGALSGSGSIGETVTLPAGGEVTFTLSVTVALAATGTVVNTASVSSAVTDPVPSNDSATDVDNISLRMGELVHGSREVRTLGALSPAEATVDHFRVHQAPYASYEAVVDATAGEVAPVELDRVGGDGTTVLQAGAAVSVVGTSRTLRWANAGAATVEWEFVRVRSGGCTTDCGADDLYRVRFYETTCVVPRFNNAGSQVTVLVLQNRLETPVAGTAWFWSSAGVLLASHSFSLGPGQTVVVNTSAIAGAAGAGGTVTVGHDGGYGALAGKTVALEPATGFSFDSPLQARPR